MCKNINREAWGYFCPWLQDKAKWGWSWGMVHLKEFATCKALGVRFFGRAAQ